MDVNTQCARHIWTGVPCHRKRSVKVWKRSGKTTFWTSLCEECADAACLVGGWQRERPDGPQPS